MPEYSAYVVADGISLELVGDLPDYFVDYLGRYYHPYYKVLRSSEREPDFRIRLDLAGVMQQEWLEQVGRPLGRVPLDLTTCAQAQVLPDGTICAVAEGNELAVARVSDAELVLSTTKPTPSVLLHFVLRIDVAAISLRIASMGLAPMHASAVRVNGHGLLIGGGKGSGKTSLALALAANGACDFVGDELVLVGVDESGLYMIGTPIPPRLGAGALRAHPRLLETLDPYLASRVMLARPDWTEVQDYKVDITVGTLVRALQIKVASVSRLEAVLWPAIGAGSSMTISELDRTTAEAAISSSLLLFDCHWMTWGGVGFNGLPPVLAEIESSQRALLDIPNFAATGARNVEGLATLIRKQVSSLA